MDTKKCPPECSCRNKGAKIIDTRKKDPNFVVAASSPATIKPSSIKTCARNEYHHIEISCPFCGYYHRHGGGKVSEPIFFGTRGSHCGKGMYTIIPPA